MGRCCKVINNRSKNKNEMLHVWYNYSYNDDVVCSKILPR
jgi:hypothetical protein